MTQGRKSAAFRSGKLRRRLARSLLGSMAMTGMLSVRPSSMRPILRPVFLLPVMPMMTAWVVRSPAAYSRGPG
jgi:hypothetical protein